MSTFIPPPSAEQQLIFLTKIQRLFAEGNFAATYKFALLISLSDLAVELGGDNGGELTIPIRLIAERFIQLYWRHATPYGTGRDGTFPGILIQNLGSQAAVLAAICEFRSATLSPSYQSAQGTSTFTALLNKVASVVSAQPLNYLQNFGGATDPFLYDRDKRGSIILKAGVAYSLRKFYTLIQQMARSRWIDHIKSNRQNHNVLGDAGDLEDFLFSASRQSLSIVGAQLRKLDGERCFYCSGTVTHMEVDHFVPFSLYPRDQAHNFVLAHPQCNRSKSNTLAAKPHLERWLSRLFKQADALSEIGVLAGIASDSATARKVANWSYATANAVGGHAWVSPSNYETVSTEYLTLLT